MCIRDRDTNTLFLAFKVGTVNKKNIDIEICDLALKVNLREKNKVIFVDFLKPVDHSNKGNTIVVIDEFLKLTIIKHEGGKWESLSPQDLSKDDLRKRRDESFARKEEEQRKLLEKKKDLKIEYDRYATTEQMRLDSQERELIAGRKAAEKQKAEDEIFRDLNERAEFKKEKEKRSDDNDIFGEEDLVKESEIIDNVVPGVRAPTAMKLEFTEKIFPNMATRETHFTEAPLPKARKPVTGAQGEKQETGNPLFLKEKGDNFMKNGDFLSAINAYDSAQRRDPNLIEAISNRSMAHMRLFDYESAIRDCEVIIRFTEGMPKEQRESDEKLEKMYIKARLRKAVCLTWKGLADEATSQLKALAEDPSKQVTQEIKAAIELELSNLKERIEANRLKLLGDRALMRGDLADAERKYEGALNVSEGSEQVLANLSLLKLKKGEFVRSLALLERVLARVAKFGRVSSTSPAPHRRFVFKLLLRQARCLLELKSLRPALDAVNEALTLEENDEEAKGLKRTIDKELTLIEIEEKKGNAVQLLKNGEWAQALPIFDECIKKSAEGEVLGYLALLANKALCHARLQQHDEVTATCLRGLTLIRSNRQRVVSLAKVAKDHDEKLKQHEIRFLVRRAHAYVQLGQAYSAKSDLEEALKLDPSNNEIKADIDGLKQALG
eukprot:TRINITY_DN5841_c0_g1_i1.p1 TRINITY_DN5841_c0_g1~~TRINITY_DN5841_c0_g1_i1.p1  ORF type:complete len:683 (-),score=234.84 TRINITY_DN5841_c0_g1_i1:129-2129(-)